MLPTVSEIELALKKSPHGIRRRQAVAALSSSAIFRSALGAAVDVGKEQNCV
jgi:hypothetical protein